MPPGARPARTAAARRWRRARRSYRLRSGRRTSRPPNFAPSTARGGPPRGRASCDDACCRRLEGPLGRTPPNPTERRDGRRRGAARPRAKCSGRSPSHGQKPRCGVRSLACGRCGDRCSWPSSVPRGGGRAIVTSLRLRRGRQAVNRGIRPSSPAREALTGRAGREKLRCLASGTPPRPREGPSPPSRVASIHPLSSLKSGRQAFERKVGVSMVDSRIQSRALPEDASLENLRKRAKTLVKEHAASVPEARERVAAVLPHSAGELKLHQAQLVVARELGLPSW